MSSFTPPPRVPRRVVGDGRPQPNTRLSPPRPPAGGPPVAPAGGPPQGGVPAGYRPWWLFFIAVLLCMAASLVVVAYVASMRQEDYPGPTVTPRVITAVPSTVLAQPSAAPSSAQVIPTGEAAGTPGAPSGGGDIQLGQYVQVSGTGDAGYLNLRAEPGLQSPVNYLALERQVFQVQAGPKEADGFTWWYLVDPATSERYGWAVRNYLEVVQGP